IRRQSREEQADGFPEGGLRSRHLLDETERREDRLRAVSRRVFDGEVQRGRERQLGDRQEQTEKSGKRLPCAGRLGRSEEESEREKQRGEHLEAHEIPVFNPLQHGCKRIGPNTRKQKHEDQSETKHGVDHGLWNHETTESQYTGSNERSGKQPVQTPLAPPH